MPDILIKCGTCGAVYLGTRVACSKCFSPGPFNEVRLSDRGQLWVYSIVHQSAPGIPTPYIAGIVDLPEGVSIRCTIIDVDPALSEPAHAAAPRAAASWIRALIAEGEPTVVCSHREVLDDLLAAVL